MVTGDADIGDDRALPRPSRAAEEQQHPDMSIMRVVVHQGPELEERARVS